MRYFAYGSNMCTARLQARIDVDGCLGHALLPGYDLQCDKRSQVDGSAKFSITPAHLVQVPGVLFEIWESALDTLDTIEGTGYRRIHVEVDVAGGKLDAITYISLEEARDPSLLPYDWYLAFAVAGAMEHDLPKPHIHRLQAWPSCTDPDTDRSAINRRILESSAL